MQETILINGKELKVGSLIKSKRFPTLNNVRVTRLFLNQEQVRIQIGCCTKKMINISDIEEILD